jgi:hypothetical protein
MENLGLNRLLRLIVGTLAAAAGIGVAHPAVRRRIVILGILGFLLYA